jgi:hypothetical protein
MAYKQNIPQPTDELDTSQADMLGNFQAIRTLIGINHGNFGTAVEGKHTFIEFPVQGSDPATIPQEVALFCKNGPTSGVPELAFKRENNGTVAVFTEGTAAGNTGYTRLPSGALIKFALYNVASALGGVFFRQNTLTIGPVDPAFTEIDAVFVTAATPLNTDTPTSIPYFVRFGATATTFDIVTNSTKSGGGWDAYQVSVMIIGKG